MIQINDEFHWCTYSCLADNINTPAKWVRRVDNNDGSAVIWYYCDNCKAKKIQLWGFILSDFDPL